MQSSCLWMGLLLLLLAAAQGQGQSQTHSSGEHFEDADKSSEYTDQQFDLRHTIPGEPGLDYPILSTPPKTSFVCKGRHEGYYADVESRCQAFRICAHTARSPQGFGFLCPNGTLFSQKNFVCDWYRNVICDDSERYYDMNAANTVGSTHEMMERVRHMMEYPMKTITKALQQAQTHSQTSPQQQQHHHQHQSLSKDLSSVSGVLTHPAEAGEPQIAAGRGEEIKSEPLNAAGLETISTSISSDDDGEGIYVNSLGELSSDPGIQFDHTNAHIVAEYPREYHYQKQKNFAERVNAGLEVLADTESTSSEVLAPDYMKHIRSNKDEATQVDLVSNINNLLDEVSSDADPSVSGYQSMAPHKIKQPFRFLSRGFAMHGDGSKGSSSAYVYNKPKQTPGTVRFTPNEIPTEDLKSTEHKHKFAKIASTTPSTTEESPALLIAPTLPTAEEAEEVEQAETTTLAAETASSTVAVPPFLLEPPILTPALAIESLGQAAALTASLPLSDDLVQVEESPEAAEKSSVHQEATKLLLAGVQLTSHDEETQVLNTIELAESSPSTTSTSTSTTPVMITSTETVTEISSTQERIRGYRRYAQNRGNSTLRRANVRPLPVVRSTTSTTTQRTTNMPTRSYLERLAASRLRLSRLSLATRSTTKAPTTQTPATTEATTTTASSLSYVRGGAEQGPSKKLSARHIDRETKVETGKASWESVHSNLQRFQVQRGNRIYTPATRASSSISSSTTSTSATSTTSSYPRPTAAASVNRGKNRYSNFKTQAPVTRTRAPTTARVYTTPRTTSSPALSTLTQQISAIASGYGYSQAPLNPPQTQKHTPHVYATQTVSDIAPPSSQSITSSLSPSSGFLSFDKLTRAIVDESVLQNFKSVQAKGSAQFQQHRPLTKTSSIGSRSSSGSGRNSIGYSKPPTAPAISSLTVPPRPSQLPQPALPTQPGIVIVRAEGQRIAPNSASNIIASLATQAPPKATQGNSYVSLNDFFSSKFGQGNANSVAGATTLQQQQQAQVQRQPAQQQHYGQQQLQQVQQQQHHHVQVQQQVQRQQQPQQQSNYITQQYQQPSQNIYQPNIYQQQSHSYQQQQQQHNPFQQQQQQQFHQQARPSIQTNQQPYLTPNIFVPYQQQQQQLPQFPPLAPPAPVTATGSVQGSFIGGRHVDHLNVQLPTLANGLIPGLQLAQKRSDVSAHQLQLTDTGGRHPASSGSGKSRERSFYSGRTSYQVPQSSVGRLPNDITQQLRGRHRRY
ncbi:uncharacterized protein YMR317W isoform X1 [Drosophila pseudoobscura]|uniref:Uncharacterized protein YMR317W isoform X1 n=1 Tax=Drosophila pseudoobscura pseudoobscura TaxID=46245 RepID=A0A6I8V483_DROPS|nr:uncharacterized protein YMR317W isoform X1 [Drosophila pseudoobscura]